MVDDHMRMAFFNDYNSDIITSTVPNISPHLEQSSYYADSAIGYKLSQDKTQEQRDTFSVKPQAAIPQNGKLYSPTQEYGEPERIHTPAT